MFSFRVDRRCGQTLARLGEIRTTRGAIPTPIFMPVGTQATVKTLTPLDLRDIEARIILANTYHLYLRPGTEVLDAFGGVHRFMAWDRPMLTDSGGFQIFSLQTLNKISDEGVRFASHLDGSRHLFTPELSMQVQQSIGADIMMVLDECCPYPADEATVRRAVLRSAAWAERCRRVHPRGHRDQALFGIVQGGMFPALRRESLERTAALDFEGLAVGGLSVGEPKDLMLATLDALMPHMPPERPRYLMGVGIPEDLLDGVERGVDMFDCVMPTRIARHGSVFTRDGRLQLGNAKHRLEERPIDETCTCYACRHFSRAYLRHLMKAGEILGKKLASLHNLAFLIGLMTEIRAALAADRFPAFKAAFLARYRAGGES